MLREAYRVRVHYSQREDLSVSPSSSVFERTGRPVGERAGRPAESSSQDAQIRTLLDRQKESKFSPSARQKLTDTYFKLIMTEEFYENYVKLLNLSEKNFTALKLKHFNDEINSFFMDSCCSQIWNYVKLIRKVSVTRKN